MLSISDHSEVNPFHSKTASTGCVLPIQLYHWLHNVLRSTPKREMSRIDWSSSSYFVDGCSLGSRNHV